MDTITHVLTGAVMSGPTRGRLGWAGPAALIAGSLAPDMDLVLGIFGGGVYFKYHRVVTNSILGIFVISLLTALIVWRLAGSASFGTIWALVLTAYCMHVFMDYTNSYGCKFFWPFGGGWYALDSVFIIDPWITGLLVLGLVLMLFKVRPAPAAAVCLALLVSYWGLKLYEHREAVGRFRSETPAAARGGAFPHPYNPFLWRMVAEGPDRFDLGWYNTATGRWSGREERLKQPDTAAVREAAQAPNAKVFLDFARFPWVSHERLDGGTLVRFQDLRF